MNIQAKFKTDHCHSEYFLAAKSYRMSDFLPHFEKIKVKDQAIATYLEEIGIEKWSRANFSAIRYNIMTSNNAESFNNTSRFFERRTLAMESNKPLPTKIETKLEDCIEAAKTLIVQPLSHYEFYVMDGDRDKDL
ncbi:hypothetical protein PanWU01x14_169790 [Parasponia andersonii]|uniref:Uncharacterized protein n=1 Tax=Parasponia andersonii TaxID=3476 RepID=A0A2P5CAH7_PARAD|nr:hypothetical protein PanWU01x14_169790 [Parasponia andersonii]